jgi:hypothetical protein
MRALTNIFHTASGGDRSDPFDLLDVQCAMEAERRALGQSMGRVFDNERRANSLVQYHQLDCRCGVHVGWANDVYA